MCKKESNADHMMTPPMYVLLHYAACPSLLSAAIAGGCELQSAVQAIPVTRVSDKIGG